MSRCWLALIDGDPEGAFASAPVGDAEGTPRGTLACWRTRAKPTRGSLRCDERIIDVRGAEAWFSLVLAPPGIRLPFDDGAVQHARREVLASTPFDAVSTLLRDNSHFAGSITVARGPGAIERLVDDPFARIFPARVLRVGPGILGRVHPPTGPCIERYGSARPWPWDRFEEQPPAEAIRVTPARLGRPTG
ncbi:MAG TPA: hypothetical protein VKG38_19330 [Solirubrobacteraceae bacterium]|nr:hypothetical protein [Solirubrobacteraceae bacterium]